MDIFSQPHGKSIGYKIQEILSLEDDRFDTFYLLVAYVRNSGVARLHPFIENFRTSGGIVKAVVGIDQKNTSIQGLKLLFSLSDELYVYHSESWTQTFHPKVYAFEKRGQKAVILIGSSNLTSGGLYTNYEINSYYEYDLTNEKQRNIFDEFKRVFEFYSTPSKCSKFLSNELLEKMIKAGTYLHDEEKETQRIIYENHTSSAHTEKIFGTEIFRAPKLRQSSLTEIAKESEDEEMDEERQEIPIEMGDVIWSKKLTNSDVLIARSGTNPTGGLRLTQAGWKIDQTKYFREVLFADFEWKEVRQAPYVEVAKIPFNVKILGKDIGQHILEIRHKPSGEAEQGNYTTSISWGELSSIIKASKLSGKMLLIRAPPKDEKEPFFIEIEEDRTASLEEFV